MVDESLASSGTQIATDSEGSAMDRLTGAYISGLLALTMGLFSVYAPPSPIRIVERTHQRMGRWFLIPLGCVLLLIAIVMTVSRLFA
jgi:hypothetical protein